MHVQTRSRARGVRPSGEPVNILLIGYGDGPAADPNRHDTLRKPLSATVFHERF